MQHVVPYGRVVEFARALALLLLLLTHTFPTTPSSQPKNGAYKAIVSGDKGQMEKLAIEAFETMMAIAHSGMTSQQFKDIVEQWLTTATHPRFNKPSPSWSTNPCWK